MKYQKIMNLLDNTANQPTGFRTKNGFITKIIKLDLKLQC